MLIKFNQATVLRDENGSLHSFSNNIVYDTSSGVFSEEQAREFINQGLAQESFEIIPTGSLDITENGTYDVTQLAQVIANISGSSTEKEEGLITVSEDTTQIEITFSNSHTTLPYLLVGWDSSNNSTDFTADGITSFSIVFNLPSITTDNLYLANGSYRNFFKAWGYRQSTRMGGSYVFSADAGGSLSNTGGVLTAGTSSTGIWKAGQPIKWVAYWS